MRIKLPEIQDEVLEIEFPDGSLETLKLKRLTPLIVSQNEKEIRELEDKYIKKEITKLDMNLRVLSLGVEMTKSIKEKLLNSPTEYLEVITSQLADMREERIVTLKKNISQTLI